MATKLEWLKFPMFFFLVLVALVSLIGYAIAHPVPQTEIHLGCAQDSLRMELIAPAEVFSETYRWKTYIGPQQVMTELQVGEEVCVIAHDSFNPAYAQIVFPDPVGTGKEDQYVRGWVLLETLPQEARDARLSIHDPWESSTYP